MILAKHLKRSMKPRIVVDSIPLLSPLTGIGRYTYEISKELEKQDTLNVSFFYGYFSKNLLQHRNKSNLRNFFKSLFTTNQLIKKSAQKILTFSNKIFTSKYDLYWEPNFIPLNNLKARKTVTSVHDFSFILYKEYHPKERIEYFEKYFFNNIVRSDMIITGSEFSKKEILERLDFQENQVRVIYHGIDHHLFKIQNDPKVDLDLPKKFILSVGSIEPRKNLIGLIKAYNQLSKEIKEEYHLVLVGFKGWNNKEIMEIINQNKEYIHYLGYISDKELVNVYNLASLFVYPSFYEGFGLPVLEAMACGTPVITSNVSSLPEVGGDAAVYCDPYYINDIKNKIKLVLSDEILQRYMVEKGLKRAKLFSWEKTAQEHIKVFEEVLES